jgi:hypothetical protein
MADTEPNADRSRAEDAKVREEWRRLERERLDEEIAEAREDAAVQEPRPRIRWLAWIAFAVALVAGIVVTIVINRLLDLQR